MDLQATLQRVSAWQRGSRASQVSAFDFFCLIDVFRYSFDMAALMSRPMDSILTPWSIYAWLRGSGMSMVSRLAILGCFVVETLNLELCRFDLDPATSVSPSNESNDSI